MGGQGADPKVLAMSDEDFSFNIDAPIRRITDEAIMVSLREFMEQQKPKPLTSLAYDAWAEKICTAATISERFDGWRNALKRVGGDVAGVRPREYSAEELLDNLERVWRELGYPPGKRKLAEYGAGISERPYKDRWGSVRKACCLLAQYRMAK